MTCPLLLLLLLLLQLPGVDVGLGAVLMLVAVLAVLRVLPAMIMGSLWFPLQWLGLC